ncbi:hypothetical protein [Pseudoalteromonas sp. T1lg22]|uniref:hypothetical protein n=1 Tax=Pseudoalteromonas sp. T1lg22 TaxID=2077096 RepID=UPI000CF60266|nr:hypothetical protein [Pseudoalteromonas sp. T1lg22]
MTKKVDRVLDIGTDLVQELGPVKVLKAIWDSRYEKRIRTLFENCAQQLHRGEDIGALKHKLDQYSESEVGQEVIFSMVNCALQSESSWCCRVLGVILGIKVKTNQPLTHIERIISKALKEMNDEELELLVTIIDNLKAIPIPEKMIKEAGGDQAKLHESLKRNSVRLFDFYEINAIKAENQDYPKHEGMLERLKMLQVISSTSMSGGWSRTSTVGLLKPNSASFKLVELARKVR